MATTVTAASPATPRPIAGRAPVWFRTAMGALSYALLVPKR